VRIKILWGVETRPNVKRQAVCGGGKLRAGESACILFKNAGEASDVRRYGCLEARSEEKSISP